jgi:hypothetical protein
MAKRTEALWRIWAFIWSIVASFIASIVMLVGFVWGVVDVLWQLVTGGDGLSASSRPAEFVADVLYWPIDLTVFAFTGDGEFAWTWM